MTNLFVNADGKPKTFWERPEGVTGQIVGVGIIVGIGWLAYHLLPVIITLLQNTIYATMLAVVAACLLFVVSDKRFWNLGKHLYMSAMRKLTQAFVEIDPIGVIKNYIQELQGKLEKIANGIAKLAGMIRQCEQEIADNSKVKDKQLKLMSAAKTQNKTMDMALASREAMRMQEANVSYEDMLKTMKGLHSYLVKVQDVVTFLVTDMKSEVKVKERKKAFMDSAVSVVRLAKSIMKGEASQMEMFNMANEVLATDLAMKMGEIDEFTRMAETMMQSVDLQNGVYEADGLKMLEEWEKRADSLLLGDSKRLMVENNPSATLPVGFTTTETSRISSNNQTDWAAHLSNPNK